MEMREVGQDRGQDWGSRSLLLVLKHLLEKRSFYLIVQRSSVQGVQAKFIVQVQFFNCADDLVRFAEKSKTFSRFVHQ